MQLRRMVATLVVVGLVFAVGPRPASALQVLIADDNFFDLDFLVTALAGHTVTLVDNTDGAGEPILTVDVAYMSQFDVVIFYASGDCDCGRELTADEQTALEAYIQGGGSLIVTGYDVIGGPDDPRLADVVRSSTYGDTATSADDWTAATMDHFILHGPFGDYRGRTIIAAENDQDDLTADTSRGAVALGTFVDYPYHKIIFTDLPAPGGSVGMWNGNEYGNDWDPTDTDGDVGLAILRNWLAGLTDTDGDGVFDADDDCPGTAAGEAVDADGCSTADDDDDGVPNQADACPDTLSCATVDVDGCTSDSDGDGVVDGCDECANTREGAKVDATGCPSGCCGASGPVAPLGLAIGLLLLSRVGARRRRSR